MSLIQELSEVKKEFPYSIFSQENQRNIYSFFGTYTPRREDLKLNNKLNNLLNNLPIKNGESRFKIKGNKIIWYKH